MKKTLRAILLCVTVLLACAAARAQQSQRPSAQDSRCKALRMRYYGVVSDKKHRTVEEQSRVEYEEGKKYLRACWDARDEVTHVIKKSVVRHEDFERCKAAWSRLGPEIKSNDRLTPERQARLYEAAQEFLRICDGVETAEARFVRGWVEKYAAAVRAFEARHAFGELAAEANKGGATPSLYARMAEAAAAGMYEPHKRTLSLLIEAGKSPDSKEVRETWAELAKALDTVVAAYARAIALCEPQEGCQVAKGSWTGKLAKYYALRHDGSTEGLQEFLSRGRDVPIPVPVPKP